MTRPEPVAGSFRDPCGFLFRRDGVLYRQINTAYKEDYELLLASGLYEELVEKKLLIPHEEASLELAVDSDAIKVIRPEPVPFVSYPYEWCFSQLKDAALTTLTIQWLALARGLILKDASAYNIQFSKGRPVFIDTLSFEKYEEGEPWVAYHQFCQHFLAPLALRAYSDERLSALLKTYLDGVPLDLASRLLPARTRLKPALLIHLHLLARAEAKVTEGVSGQRQNRVSKQGMLGIVDNLRAGVAKLTWKPEGTLWGDYYDETNYSRLAFDSKRDLVTELLQQAAPEFVWDLGANTGEFSRIAAGLARQTLALDSDPAAVERHYLRCKTENETSILPLISDATNPSPGLGWDNAERDSLADRGRPDTLLALALVHHLAIGNNLPLGRIADSFAGHCRNLIVEFVPKSDSQIERMLSTREDIFPDYSPRGFEAAFAERFETVRSEQIRDSDRTLYLMTRRAN